MNDLDTAVRETLRDLAAEATPASLAGPALRRARWFRARRTAVSTAVAVTAVAAVATPYTVLTDRPAGRTGPPATATSTPAPPPSTTPARPSLADGPVRLPGDWLLAGGIGAGARVTIWDRVRGRYVPVPYDGAWPAPEGPFVAVSKTERVGILNLVTGKVAWLDRPSPCEGGDWTSDGRSFVYPGAAGDSTTAITVVDAAAGIARRVRDVPLTCEVGWLPGDREIAVGYGSGAAEAYAAGDGRRTRTFDVPGLPVQQHNWSPDGRQAVATDQGATVIREGATGRVVCALDGGQPPTGYWAGTNLLLLVRPGEVVGYSTTCQRVARYPWPVEFQPEELHNFPLAKA